MSWSTEVKVCASRTATVLPRYVSLLNLQAARAGLRVSTPRVDCLDMWTDAPPEERLLVDWTGPSSAFAATGFLTPCQLRILTYPIKREHFLSVPQTNNRHARRSTTLSLLLGYIAGSPDRLRWIVDFGPAPLATSLRGEVEVSTSLQHVNRHGTAEALMADGVPAQRLPTGKRSVQNGESKRMVGERPNLHWEALRWWGCRRFPNGTFLYREDSAQALAMRQRECDEDNEPWPTSRSSLETKPARSRSHLTLVVDNT